MSQSGKSLVAEVQAQGHNLDSIAVAENNYMSLPSDLGNTEAAQRKPDPRAVPRPIPSRPGEPSTIDHVVCIIKENRSYDQYFGSLGKGNGDPTLNSYQDDVIPNQRKLAREYVLLDNFYANGGDSADGHQWLTQAAETDCTYWPGYNGRSYPKNRDLLCNAPCGRCCLCRATRQRGCAAQCARGSCRCLLY